MANALHLPSAMAHTLWHVLLSESEQIHLLTIAVSFAEVFSMRCQEPELHQALKLGTEGFGQERRAEGLEEKAVGKNMLRNSLHNLLENMLNTLTCAHNSHWPDPWHKED